MTRYNAEADLATQLEARGLYFEREHKFCATRKWRADLFVWCANVRIGDRVIVRNQDWTEIEWQRVESGVLVEVDGGGGAGRHGTSRGMRQDAEKQSAAAALGWRVIRLDPSHVKSGKALAWIEAALGLRSDVAELFKLPEKKRARVKRTPNGAGLPERVLAAIERSKR